MNIKFCFVVVVVDAHALVVVLVDDFVAIQKQAIKFGQIRSITAKTRLESSSICVKLP